jgi:hypothetical protein
MVIEKVCLYLHKLTTPLLAFTILTEEANIAKSCQPVQKWRFD